MHYFKLLIEEMQSDEPNTLSYMHTLHMFKTESLLDIFRWLNKMFTDCIQTIETENFELDALMAIVDTLSS